MKLKTHALFNKKTRIFIIYRGAGLYSLDTCKPDSKRPSTHVSRITVFRLNWCNFSDTVPSILTSVIVHKLCYTCKYICSVRYCNNFVSLENMHIYVQRAGVTWWLGLEDSGLFLGFESSESIMKYEGLKKLQLACVPYRSRSTI